MEIPANWIKVAEVAKILGTSRGAVHQHIKMGRLKPVWPTDGGTRSGLPWYYLREDAEALRAKVGEAPPLFDVANITENLMSAVEAAEYLGLTMNQFQHWDESGYLPVIKIRLSGMGKGMGRADRRYVRREDVEWRKENPPQRLVKSHKDRGFVRPPSRDDCIYMACLIDGEGTVCLSSHVRKETGRQVDSLVIAIYNTHLETMAWVKETFGGTVKVLPAGPTRSKPLAIWRTGAARAGAILRLCVPFMRIKKDKAQWAVEFQDDLQNHRAGTWAPLTAERIAWRNELRAKISASNKRGKPSG